MLKSSGKRNRIGFIILVTLCCLIGTGVFLGMAQNTEEVWGFKVVAEYPHDPQAFTQGLIVVDGQMYEGTGIEGKSTLRRTDFKTGKVEQSVPLNANYFGEGIAAKDNQIYQLTWKHEIGLIYDLKTFNQLGTFKYVIPERKRPTEGWGLTYDGKHFIRSDGSKTLWFHDPKSFKIDRQITARSNKGANGWELNELEYVKGEIWANIWYQDRIVRISPKDGKVLGIIELSSLYNRPIRQSEDVMNGIAYDAENDRLFVTGKNWSKLFEIKVGRDYAVKPR